MNRAFRLTSATDIKRVRRTGKSYAHPLVFLIVSPNGLQATRIGVSAGQSLGSAVRRNRAKRRMREAARRQAASLPPGWDLLLVARSGLDQAPWQTVVQAVAGLLHGADLAKGEIVRNENGSAGEPAQPRG
jgi:ribonuclease P protein component